MSCRTSRKWRFPLMGCANSWSFEPHLEKKRRIILVDEEVDKHVAEKPGSYQNTSTQAAQRWLKRLVPCGRAFVEKKHLWHRGSPCIQVVATRRAKSNSSWECPLAPSPLPSNCESSLPSLDPRSVTLGPWMSRPLPSHLVLFFFQSALVRCSAGRSRCSPENRWTQYDAIKLVSRPGTDLARVKATDSHAQAVQAARNHQTTHSSRRI